MTTSILYKTYGKSSSRKLRWAIYYILYRMDPQKHIKTNMFAQQSQKSENYMARRPFGSTTKSKTMTTSISYKRYKEILSQKVALGYLLHLVGNVSSTTY